MLDSESSRPSRTAAQAAPAAAALAGGLRLRGSGSAGDTGQPQGTGPTAASRGPGPTAASRGPGPSLTVCSGAPGAGRVEFCIRGLIDKSAAPVVPRRQQGPSHEDSDADTFSPSRTGGLYPRPTRPAAWRPGRRLDTAGALALRT